uniref:RING-type domain-containing protein n=1 Tax=Graphocephala atropunctata TaxID=36148 RepID=A0A1B6MPE9_9HEMI
MEDFTPEQLRSMFQKMLEITACAVCLETVTGSDAVLCVNEHMLCGRCKQDLAQCPTCSQQFCAVKPQRTLVQVLGTLPHRCCHNNCNQYISKDTDHETYCGWRPTQCKVCDETVPGKDIYDHVVKNHYNYCFDTDYLPSKYPDGNKIGSFTAFFKVSGHTLWEKTKHDPLKHVLTMSYHYVPNGVPNCDIFVEKEFKSTSTIFKSKFQLNPNPETDTQQENIITIPKFMLSKFMSEDGKDLVCTTNVTFD